MATVLIALGSNVGRRRGFLEAALAALQAHPAIEVAAASSFIETEPVGGPPGQGLFLNAAARLETTLEPEALLGELKAIERRLGRRQGPRWGPREIDLDLLLWGDRTVETADLVIPHPRLRERRFVLEPLSQIAPDAVDPVTGRTVRQLLDDLKA